MAFTNEAAERVLKGFLGQASGWGILGSICYMGLSTTTPAADGTNFTEPSADSGYKRVIIGSDGQSLSYLMEIISHHAENSQIIYFPEATASWGTLTDFGLFASEDAEKPLIYGALTDGSNNPTPVTVPVNYVPLFRVGQFTMTLA